jgi:hypothetical protein
LSDADDGRAKALARRYLKQAEFRDPKAFWSDAFPDDYGYIWAEYARTQFRFATDTQSKPSFRVFSPEGEYLGDTEWVSDGSNVSWGHLLTIQTDVNSGGLDLVVYLIRSVVEGLEYP